MILHQKIALCVVTFIIAGIVVNKKGAQRRQNGSACEKFIKILRFIRAELPLRVNIIKCDSEKFKVFKKVDTSNLNGINEMLVYKLKLLYNNIQEICYYFDVEMVEFISYFNILPYEKYAKYAKTQGCEYSRPNFDWPKKFSVNIYALILKKYLVILEKYLETDNYLEFLLQENMLYDYL